LTLIAVVILWYAFILLYPLIYGGLTACQNYINNAYLWLLVGLLFRLPQLQAMDPGLAAVPSRGHTARGGFEF